MPSVNRLYIELRERGLQVLLVNFREDAALVGRTVRERGYRAPVLLDASGDTTGRVYGVFGPPTMYFVDREGRLVGRAAGPRDWDSPIARRFIESLLDTPGGR
ncbi:MAG: TlpA family protein disulfide reductase [Candidatus Rokubacteria bacterium]|nr:TlpA family protein disulfide reductase [Candidatus Rokubacteria bacterium]